MKKKSFPVSFPPARRMWQAAFSLLFALSLLLTGALSQSTADAKPRSKSAKPTQKRAAKTKRNARPARGKTESASGRRRESERERERERYAEPTIGEEGEEGEEGENIEARERWFMFKRSYPFDEPPSEGRRKAWLSRPKDAEVGTKGIAAAAVPTWRSIGPSPTTPKFPTNWGATSGRINAIAVSPSNPQIILVGASTGGIWRSTDGGANFAPVSDTQVDLAVGAIAFSRSNPTIVYAGMGDLQGGYFGTGILKSTDSGATWTRISNGSLPPLGTTASILVDRTNPNRVYVLQATRTMQTSYNDPNPDGNLYRNGFYVSSDGGVNWTQTLRGRPRDLAIHPNNPQILYVGMNLVDAFNGVPSGAAGVFKSVDGGNTWLPTPLLLSTFGANTSDVRVATTPANPDAVYVLSGQRSSGLRIDVVNGITGVATSKSVTGIDPGQFGYNSYIYVDPADANNIYVGTRDVYKSVDGGNSWSSLTRNFNGTNFGYTPGQSNSHPDQHSFAFDPTNSDVIYIGNDGGISQSTDGGAHFSSLNATLTLSQFVGLTTHPTVDGLTYGGTQDNGTQVRLAGGSGWREFAEGDGGHPVIVLTPSAINSPATVFSTYVYGSIRRWALNTGNGLPSFDNFSTSNATFCEGTSGQRIAFYPPFTGNGVDQTIYFGTYKLFISNNLGTTWTPGISGGCSAPDLTRGGSDVLSAIGVERKANAQVIYTASAQGRVMITKDGGASFTDITNGLPTRFPESITVNPSNAAIAYITFSGYGTGHVFRTTDFGQTWSNIGGTVGLPTSIPNVPANALLIDPVTPTTLYVGTDIGVFRSTDNGATWATFNNGMLPTVVTGFAVTAGGTIQLSTYGRGMFELTNSLVVCSYAVDPLSPQNFTSAGGAGSFNITTGVNCAWTATSLAPWITVTNGSGMGSGVVNYTVAPNTGGARNGQILHTSDSFYTIGQAAAPVVATTLQFSLPTYQFNEGDGRATITVTRGGDTSNPVSVNLSTVDDPASVACATNNGTAYARCDYATTVETVTFAAGDSQPKNVTIPLIDDSYAEGTEAVQLRLSNPSGATLGTQATATLNITSNDAAGAANPINTTPFFVRMQYLDFLSREPEAGEPWSAILNGCPNAFNTDPFSASAGCDRNIVSSSFFGSPEFRLKGFYVFNFYRVAFNRLPEYAEIIPDMRSVTGQTSAEVYAKRAAFPVNFTQRPDFRAAYDAFSNADFVNTLMDRYTLQQITTPDPQNPESGTKVTLARLDLLNQLAAGTLTRAKVLRAIVESDEVGVRERNRAFVAMQYYGYLRRTPETDGFNNWLNYLNAHPTDSRTMVDGFMNAVEYRLRFGQ